MAARKQNGKLSIETVQQARYRFFYDQKTLRQVCEEFGIARSTADNLMDYETYPHVPDIFEFKRN